MASREGGRYLGYPMKVLFLANWLPTTDDPGNGLFVREHARAISQAGADLLVLHVRLMDGPLRMAISTEVFEDEGLKGLRVTIKGRMWKLAYLWYWWQFRLVRRALRRAGIDLRDIDLVHSNVVHPSGVIGDLLAQELSVPHVITEHWTRLEQYFSKDLLSSQGARAYRRAAMIFPVSEYLAGVVARYAGKQAVIKVVPNVVPGEMFHERVRNSRDEIRLLMAARWNRTKLAHKRPDLVIDALTQLQREGGRHYLLQVVGGGNRISELRARCDSLGVRAEFLGHQGKERLAELMSEADLFLHPTERETFSLVVAEALKCGTPVVASNVGAIPELLELDSGILVSNTVDAWTSGIDRALRHDFKRKAIAKRWEMRFTPEEIGRSYMNFYQKLM